MRKLTLALFLLYFASGIVAQTVVVSTKMLQNAQYATVFTSTASGRIIDSRHFNEQEPPSGEYFILSTNLAKDFHLTVLLKGRLGFSSFAQTYAKTIWRCRQDTVANLEVPAFIPLSKIPTSPLVDGLGRIRLELTGPEESFPVETAEIPLREFGIKNFVGNRHDFFGVDCNFSDLRKLGGLRDAVFKRFVFQSWLEEPNLFLIFDRKEKAFRELFLPALVTKDSTFWVDFQQLPFIRPPVYFNLKPYNAPWVKLLAKLTNGEEVSLGSIGEKCQEEELVQHPVVSQPVIEYRKFLRYYIDRTEDDFTTITRTESSPFLDDFNFSEIDYRSVDVVLGNGRADLSALPSDLTAWQVHFALPKTSSSGWQVARTPDWYYKSGRGALLPPGLEGGYSWSIEGEQPVAFVDLPDLPEGAAQRYFTGRNLNDGEVVGASFTAALGFEQVAYAYWLVTPDLY